MRTNTLEQLQKNEKLKLIEIETLLQEGRIDEVITRGHQFLIACSGNVETFSDLGNLAIRWGRLNGSRAVLLLSIKAYGKAIEAASEQLLDKLFAGRADAYALLGMAEEAIADYSEVVKRNPENTRAALSQAEMFIWLNQRDAARDCLEALDPKLTTTGETAVSAWLMCHILNLSGRSFTSYRKFLEEIVEKGSIEIQYNVRAIEPHLHKLDCAKYNRDQIDNAWKIQRLMLKLIEAAPPLE